MPFHLLYTGYYVQGQKVYSKSTYYVDSLISFLLCAVCRADSAVFDEVEVCQSQEFFVGLSFGQYDSRDVNMGYGRFVRGDTKYDYGYAI